MAIFPVASVQSQSPASDRLSVQVCYHVDLIVLVMAL